MTPVEEYLRRVPAPRAAASIGVEHALAESSIREISAHPRSSAANALSVSHE
jgi:hypothetical protein